MLADLFRPKNPPLIGVDISSSAVKMVELADAGKGTQRIERYAIEAMPKDVLVDGNIVNHEAASDVVRRCWKKLGSRTKNVALALPTAAVITKKIICPAGLRDDELEAQVEGEANQYIPFALDEVNLDFQVVGTAPSSPDEVEVLIAASRKEKVEDRMAVVEDAGLKALVVDVESFALQLAFELIRKGMSKGGRDQNVAVVDIGANVMHITVLRNDQAVYQREQAFGGNQLNQQISKHYGLSLDEAESAKKTGSLPASYEAEVLRPFLDNAAGAQVPRRCIEAIAGFLSAASCNTGMPYPASKAATELKARARAATAEIVNTAPSDAEVLAPRAGSTGGAPVGQPVVVLPGIHEPRVRLDRSLEELLHFDQPGLLAFP